MKLKKRLPIFILLVKTAIVSILVCLALISSSFWVVRAAELKHAGPPTSQTAKLGNCSIYPPNNIWNARIDSLPINSRSDEWVNNIGRTANFHMDFGSGTWDGGPIGIPYNIADGATPKVSINFYYPDQSDPGPYPIPSSPLIEFGSDHHILIVDSSSCKLYEIYDASYSGGSWSAGSGAIWDLNSNVLRPDTWTSADAAGLPILPGLVRYDEIASGKIEHAIRFTAAQTNRYIWPARHLTSNSSTAPQIPPMGARFRLKASFNISGYSPQMQVLLQAMKTYGIILADNGSNWYVSGAPDPRWDNTMLHTLDVLSGNDFEAVDTSVLMVDSNSGEAKSATVVISGNAGIAGAILSYSDGTYKTVTAGNTGEYSIHVYPGWTGTITPSINGYVFSPVNRSYTNLIADQSGQDYSVRLSADTAGVFRPSNGALYLKFSNFSGYADIAINYGIGGDYPVTGDWDGNTTDTIGIYRNGLFYLRNSNTIGYADLVVAFGSPGDQPVAGDWNGDGIDTIGVYRSSTGTFYLRNSNTSGPPDMTFYLGIPGDIGIAGDWNGDGIDTSGVFRPGNGALYLKNTNTTGFADVQINYGLAGDRPVTGDWDHDGIDTIGVYRNGTFLLRNSNTIGYADLSFGLGLDGDMPIAGNWDGLP